jgi:hypothetical protein
VIYAAIINCRELDVHGNSTEPLPVIAFGKFFLTEPIPSSPDPDAGTIFSELFSIIEPGSVSKEVARDLVQLYR